MHCEQVQPNLLDYSRKLLSGPESEQIRAHLCECEECAAVLRDEIACFEALAAIPEPLPSNDVWALVRSRTKPTRVRPLVWLHSLVSTNLRKAATACVAIAVIGFGFYNSTLVNTSQPTSTRAHVVAVNSDDPLAGHTEAIMDSIDEM